MIVVFPDMHDSVIGKVNYAARVINPLNRTFTVEMLLVNNNTYHPNMIAIMKINDYTSPKPVLVIPTRVVMRGEDGLDFVVKFKANGGKWAKLPIFVVSNSANNELISTYKELGVTKYYLKAENKLADIISDIKTELGV